MKKRTLLRNFALLCALGSAAAMVAGHVAMQRQNVSESSLAEAAEGDVRYSAVRVEAESADALYDTYHWGSDPSIGVGECGNGVTDQGLTGLWDTNFAVYENVDFVDGAVEVSVRKNVPRSSAVEIWIDCDVDASAKSFSGGTKIADVEFSLDNMGWSVYETFTAPVTGTSAGIHRVVLLVKAAGSTKHDQKLGSLDWFEFKVVNNRVDIEGLLPAVKDVAVHKHLSKQLEVAYVPENAMQRDVVWSVVSAEPEGAVEVSGNGVVKGVAAGTAVVRATSTHDAEIYADFNVTVENTMEEVAVRLEAEDAVALYDTYHYDKAISAGSVNDPEEDGAQGLNNCWNGNFAVYENVNFNSAVYSVLIRKGYVRGSKMEIWIDPEIDADAKAFTGGTLIGTVEYPKPDKDDWSRWQTFEVPVDVKVSGVHNVVLRFLAGGGSAADKNYGAINWVEFKTLKKEPQGPIVVEGENWVDAKECSVANLNGEGSEASGGKGWGSDNAHKGAYATYKFEADEAGAYDLSVWYVTMNTRWVAVEINDNPANIFCCDELTGGWNGSPSADRPGVACKTARVYCREGENTLVLRPIYGYSPEEGRDQPYAPSVDRLVLEKVAVAMKEPAPWTEADRIKVEIENYSTKTGNGSVSNRAAFSGGKGGVLNSGGCFNYEIEIAEAGVYMMTIDYATSQRRWVSVSVNGGEPQHVGFLQSTNSWGSNAGDTVYGRQVLVWLRQGSNVVSLSQYNKEGADNSENADSPALDCFTLDRVDYPAMEVPERQVMAYRASLADAATWDTTFGDNLFNDHDEYTASESDANEATVTARFPWPVLITGYAVATGNNTESWTLELSADGETWRDAVASSETKLGAITTVVLSKPYDGDNTMANAVRYARLNISGSEPASLGEFCLFGNPYVSAECHVPAGVLVPGNVDYESSHQGFDSGSWHEGIDKLFNGICTDRFTVAQSGDGGMGDYDDITVQVYLSEAVVVKSYMLSTHYTTMFERNPTEWQLFRGAAATDVNALAADGADGDWVMIDSREKMDFVVPGSTLPIHIDNESAASDYKLVIKNRRDKATHLAAFQMFAKSGSTGIEANDADGFSIVMVAGGNGAVEIASDEERPYNVYNMTGVGVSAGSVAGVARVELPHGIYVVAVGTKTFKVVVK